MIVYLSFTIQALRNLKSYWKQSIAAMISVMAGFMAFVIFEGYLQNIYDVYKTFNTNVEMYGDLIIEKKDAFELEGRAEPWDYALNETEQTLIQNILIQLSPRIETTVRFLQITGSLDTSSSSTTFQGLAYDVNNAALMRGPWKWDTYWGKPLNESTSPNDQMILGLRLAQKIGCLPEVIPGLKKYSIEVLKRPEARPFLCENEDFQLSAMTESGQMNAFDLSVSGIQDVGFVDRDSRYIVLSLPTAQKLFNTKKVSYYSVRLKHDTNQNLFIQDFETLLKNQRLSLRAQETQKTPLPPQTKPYDQDTPTKSPTTSTSEEILTDRSSTLKIMSPITITPWEKHFFGILYQKTLSLLNVIRNFLISIVVFVGSMSVFNTLVKLVKERTPEIGMLRSLGFLPRQIRALFFLESLFLSWAGCIIGTVLSLIVSLIINQLEITYPSGQFSTESEFIIKISASSYIYGFLLMTIISLLACKIATSQPSKSNIAHLLTHS